MRTAAALIGQLYRTLCIACLADELGITQRDADDVARWLAVTRFARDWQRCGRCREDDMVLAYVPTAPLAHGAF
ncbi:MAG: hypothetical protein HYU41_21885 [Candidatus Rokubacteria bacterium]|nr:hypothetical protein [Candidatus Rokubacteria bacterium]